MEKEKDKSEPVFCPIGKFFYDLEQTFGQDSTFSGHLKKSRIELLKAVRSLVDGKIEDLEKKSSGKKGRKATKIKVD